MKRKVIKFLSVVFAAVVLSIIVGVIGNKISEKKYANILKDKIVPLNTVKPREGFEDLKPLESILKDKKIVSIGEATHGTKEFFQMKHRMLEFLVEKMGYRLFAMEAGFGDVQVVNDYILSGEGDKNEVVKALKYWVWETEEIQDMIEWMKDYNKDPKHKEKIKFYGFDLQTADVNKEKVLQYIKKVDKESLGKYEDLFSEFNDDNISSLKENKLKNIKNNIKDLQNLFKENKEKYVSKSLKNEYEKVYQDLNVISQCIELNLKSNNGIKRCQVRDYYMAENVKWILDYEKQFNNDKIMLWAHNGHVTKEFPTYKPMGANLKKFFGDDMYVIGVEFYKGSFRAFKPGERDNKEKPEEFFIDRSAAITFAHNLQSVDKPVYFMDFKEVSKNDTIKKWLSKSKLVHEIGAEYSENNMLNSICAQKPLNCFDGLIFINNTTPSVGID